MPRYRLAVEYDGSPYVGFQAQSNGASIQGELERAILAFSGETIRIQGAGRTDTGVHATGQVVHLELAKDWRAEVVMNAINAHLVAAPIAVLSAEAVDDEFHARFSATGRRYLYRILSRAGPAALDQGRVWHFKTPLDTESMGEAATRLIGIHDFTTFRDAACQAKSPIKTLDAVEVSRFGEELRITFAARSFLHRQVRSMVGSLVEVGRGRWSPNDLAAALDAKDRARCGPVAPAQGLYLTEVIYDSK